MVLRIACAWLAALLLGACATSSIAPPVTVAEPAEPVWAFEQSDLPVDPDYRFGRLDNGMRYVVRRNATPAGQGLVRLWIGSGSLSETDSERGLAHYVEHMAFNGSTNVPEGEMVKLLEREGLAFGADTNASTGYERTLYKLDLPRNDTALLDTALMIMRETASELTISPDAVERERGVILAERRDRNNYVLRNYEEGVEFMAPDAHYGDRLPIGTIDVLTNAGADDVRGYYEREYVPENAVLLVVGDFDAAAVEQAIVARFADWRGPSDPAEPDPGPVDPGRSGLTDIFTDPAQSEQFTAMRIGAWIDGPDSAEQRRKNLLQRIGYAIVNRRLQSRAREGDAPFRSAGVGTGDIFEIARITRLVVYTPDDGWQAGIAAAVEEYRRALAFGFTDAEVAEQVAIIRNQVEAGVSGADTRSNNALMNAALSLVDSDFVPTTPQTVLERFEAVEPDITPDSVLEALEAELVPLDDALLRYEGRDAPEGGAEAIRAVWDAAMAAPLAANDNAAAAEWAYTDFGNPGEIVSDTLDARLDIRELRFANGLRLNLKTTDLEQDRILFELNIDGGVMLQTADNPLATNLFGLLPEAGLGKHSADELQTIFAGRSVGLRASAAGDSFVLAGRTRPRDLELQLQLLAAAVSDPGYRPEAELQYRRSIRNYFKSLRASPGAALSSELGGILSDNDSRFTRQELDDYLALTFAKLREDVGGRLTDGALELALVGDFDQDEAIGLVASTLGALPPREVEFRPYSERRDRSFTSDRTLRTLTHDGEPDQASLRMIWPTRDDSDLRADLTLALLQRVVRLEVYDKLREELGEAYSPYVGASQSGTYRNYGTFSIGASVAPDRIDTAREAVLEVLDRLRAAPVDADTLERGRKPVAERFANALKTNGGWMGLVDRAQSESDRIERFQAAPDMLASITPAELLSAAQTYLGPDDRVEIVVLPSGETAEDQVSTDMDMESSTGS